ncbi:conserved hypothetical protein [Hyphomicrobiales bacterium]|jgi:hypothetical protein|nr:conserved hypothetical protein [Hyphomicrobiales bacterium]CAH1702194.1 conserved hypothetical protein [Hyphomicrobiales bacterium]CAI0346398.1 conserved hypothetical protein [Hyphomicrobiales bacterium]
MIRAAFFSLAGAWIAGKVDRGEIPERLAVPLTMLATRLPTPLILAGALGYGWYRMSQEARAMRARDVTPERRARPAARPAKSPRSRVRKGTKRAQKPAGEAADV